MAGNPGLLARLEAGVYELWTAIRWRGNAGLTRRKELSWSAAVLQAKQVVHAPETLLSVRTLLSWRLSSTNTRQLFQLARVRHPLLLTMKDCMLERNGHNLRPLLVLLMAKAIGRAPGGDQSLCTRNGVLASQAAVAEITEMIHVASILHRDVVDVSTPAAVPRDMDVFGNKYSVLTGDFLLSKAIVALARLQNVHVVALMSRAVADFIEGNSRWLNASVAPCGACEDVVHTSYLRTASLVARSCRAVAILAGADKHTEECAYVFGKHMGVAYQVMEDILAYKAGTRHPLDASAIAGVSATTTGCCAEGQAMHTGGLEQARQLVAEQCELAAQALQPLPHTDARAALLDLTVSLSRKAAAA